MPLASLALRRRRVHAFEFAAASFALGLLAAIALTTAAKAFVPRLTAPLYYALSLGVAAIALVCLRRRVAPARLVAPALATIAWSSVGVAIVIGYTLSTRGFRLVDEDRYWTQDLYAQVAAADFGSALGGVAIEFEDAAGRHEGLTWRLGAQGGAVVVRNPGKEPAARVVRLLVEAHGESKLRIAAPGRPARTLYLQPRFELRHHPRNFPPANVMVDVQVHAPPGETRIELALAPWPRPDHAAYAWITNATTTSRAAFWRVFNNRYLVANTGDVREQISLARSLLDKPFLYSYSYNGTVFDGGGYTISNLPLPYYVQSFALLLLGDSLLSLHALYLAEIAALYLVLVALMRTRLRSNRGPAQLVALFPVLAYATLMRFMAESLYVHTLLTLLALAGVYCLRRRRYGQWALYALLGLLTKGGVVLVGLLAALALIVRPARLDWRKLAGSTALAAAAAGALLLMAGAATGSLDAWLKLAGGTDYAGRFKLLRALCGGDAAAFEPLAMASWDLTARIALACALLPVFLVFRRDRLSVWLLLTGLVFHAIVCASDVVWGRFGEFVHPLNYFTPAAVLLAVAGGRAVLHQRQALLPVAAALGMACLLACRLYVRGYEQHFVSPGVAQREDFALAVNDFLIRRGAAALKAGGRPNMAAAESLLTEATRPRQAYALAPTPRMRVQVASAHYLLAQLEAKRGDMKQAESQARQALEAWPDYMPARQWLDRVQPNAP